MYKLNPEPIRILNDYNFNEFVSMGQNVVVEFYAPWVPFRSCVYPVDQQVTQQDF